MDPFSYSSSSSSPSSSSPSHHHHHHHHHQQRTLTFIPPPPPGTDNSGNASVGSWLGTRFDPDGEHLNFGSTEEEPEEPGMPVSGGTYSSVAEIEKEHMFDKVVTPSDVGKLNRLVIPKQHAEKYFPLDSSANDKGLLLNFEDRNGKPWRFRYSYWNSSQSYVMTKGWSRFVKEKKLDAGDIVSFQRGVGEAGKDRLFIDWRRRPEHRHPSSVPPHGSVHWGSSGPPPHPFLLRHVRENPQNGYFGGSGFNYGYGNVVNVSPCSGGSLYYLSRWSMAQTLPPQVGGGGNYGGNSGGPEPSIPVVFDSVPVVQGKAAGKRLRLFGVNLDCPNPESSDPQPISHAIAIGSQPHPPPPLPQSHHQLQLASASSSPSPSQNPHLQLRLYNGIPLMSKGEASSSSSMSLDLEI